MEKKKGLGQSLIGLFVQKEVASEEPAPPPKAPPRNSLDLDLDLPDSPPLDPPSVVKLDSVAPADLDFPGVLRRQGVNDEDQGSIEKALTLLRALPEGTPVEVRRQIVTASLNAFGISVDKIVEAALLHEAALGRYVKLAEVDTQASISRVQRTIKDLEQQIAEARAREAEALAKQQAVVQACSLQRLRATEVLTFFATEVERVRSTSIRLSDLVNAEVDEAPPTRASKRTP